MHISEGVLTLPTLISGGLITTAGTLIGLKKINYDQVMTVGLFASAFFIASFIHIPLGPSSVHLLLNGLLGLILGWAAFPAILAALFLQAVLFGYGGIVVLGVNTAIISVPAVLFGLLLKQGIRDNGRKRLLISFCAGFLSMFGSSLLMAGGLILSNEGFQTASYLLVLWNLPIAILEGIITMFTVSFLARVQPEILSFSLEEQT